MAISVRQVLNELARRWRHPGWVLLGINQLYYSLIDEYVGEQGIDVMDKNWDNLVILDSCRFDYFKREFERRPELSGDLSRVRSLGAYTNQWLSRNFDGGAYHDTVYVTQSPQLYHAQRGEYRFIDVEFHDVIEIWDESYHPSAGVEAALDAAERYPNKRLLIHLLPPHTPFLEDDPFADVESHPWEQVTTGAIDVSDDVLRDAYQRNLEIGLNHVQTLLPKLTGKTVVTADHGQLLGDRLSPIPVKGYGHPGVNVAELVEVPWLELAYEQRRRIRPDPPAGGRTNNTADEAAAEEALRDLGYLD